MLHAAPRPGNRLRYTRSTIFPIALRAELVCSGPIRDVGHQSSLRLGLAAGPGAPGDAADVAAFKEREIEGNFRNFAGGKSDHEIAAEPAERTQRRLGIAAADRIVNYIDAALAAKFFERAAKVLTVVVHGFIGAVLASEDELVVRRSAGDDTRAHDLADFDAREPGAAGGAEDDKRLAGLERGPLAQSIERGAISHRQASGAFEGELIGDFGQTLRGHRDNLARGAPAAIARDAIPGSEISDAAADALDNAGELRAGRKRKWRLVLVLAGDDQRVEKVERHCLDAHDGFAWRGARRLDVSQFEGGRRPKMRAENSFHPFNPWCKGCCNRPRCFGAELHNHENC